MSFFGAFFRALSVMACCVVAVVIYSTMADAISTMQVASINAETTQYLFGQQQETIRFLAEQNGLTTRAAIAAQASQVWAREVSAAATAWAIALAVAAVGSVLAWQGSKTLRHWLTERNRERAILLAFRAEYLPDAPPRSVRVENVDGQRMIRDYSTLRQWPVSAAQAALVERGLLTVDA